MKILKIKYCNEVWHHCFYLRTLFSEKEFHCRHPEIVKKLQDSKFISKHKFDTSGYDKKIKIPKWCPLENYKNANN